MQQPDGNLLVPVDPQRQRRNAFDMIRLAMAVLVVWSHSFALWKGSESGEPVSLLLAGTYNAGNIAVLTFFAISGFLITASWERSKSARTYLLRRVRRIYPGYLVAVSICSLAVVPLLAGRPLWAIDRIDPWGAASNLLLHNYIVGEEVVGPVNGSLWSIPYEFWCYLGVMALGAVAIARRRWAMAIAGAAIVAIRIWLDLTGRRPAGWFLEPVIGFAYLWFDVAPPFLLGGAAYFFRERLPRSRLILAVLLIATLGAAHLPIAPLDRLVATRTILPFALVYATLYAAFPPTLRVPNAETLGGDFSYGTYLYAYPIQRLLEHFGHPVLSFPGYVALSILLSLSAGAASWFVVERWFVPSGRRDRTTAIRREKPLAEETALVAP